MKLEIREFNPSDDEGVRTVAREAHSFLRKTYRRKKTASAEPAASFTRLVAVADGGIVGTATYEVRNGGLYFGSLGVLETHRRRGVTREIVQHLEKTAAGLGLPKLSCSTIEETGNIIVFEKLGFKQVSKTFTDRHESPDGHRLHEVYLEKEITILK